MRAAATMAAILALTGLAGCASRIDQPLSPTFGLAVASLDSQIIDPTPAPGIPETSGATAAAAVQRYQDGKVKPLEVKSSSALGGTSNSSSEGGATTTTGDKK